MKNILFFFISDIEDKTFTGGPRGVLNLIEILEPQKYKPILVSQVNSLLVKEVASRDLSHEVIPFDEILRVQNEGFRNFSGSQFFQALISFFRYSLKVHDFVKRNDIDLIWARNIKSVLLSIIPSILNRKPLVWDIGLEKKSQGIFWWINLLALTVARKILTESESQPQKLFGPRLTSIFERKITTIYRGISIERVEKIAHCSENRFDEKNDDSVTIINISSINPRKNQLLLLNSILPLTEIYQNLRLLIVGASSDDAYFEELKHFVEDHTLSDFVSFTGWRSDIPELLAGADIFVLCSHAEGLSYSIAEAMFSKLPVIATNVGGALDLVHDGETGFLVEDNDETSMTRRLGELLEDSKKRVTIGNAGYEMASSKYDVYNFSENIDSFLNSTFSD